MINNIHSLIIFIFVSGLIVQKLFYVKIFLQKIYNMKISRFMAWSTILTSTCTKLKTLGYMLDNPKQWHCESYTPAETLNPCFHLSLNNDVAIMFVIHNPQSSIHVRVQYYPNWSVTEKQFYLPQKYSTNIKCYGSAHARLNFTKC